MGCQDNKSLAPGMKVLKGRKREMHSTPINKLSATLDNTNLMDNS